MLCRTLGPLQLRVKYHIQLRKKSRFSDAVNNKYITACILLNTQRHKQESLHFVEHPLILIRH